MRLRLRRHKPYAAHIRRQLGIGLLRAERALPHEALALFLVIVVKALRIPLRRPRALPRPLALRRLRLRRDREARRAIPRAGLSRRRVHLQPLELLVVPVARRRVRHGRERQQRRAVEQLARVLVRRQRMLLPAHALVHRRRRAVHRVLRRDPAWHHKCLLLLVERRASRRRSGRHRPRRRRREDGRGVDEIAFADDAVARVRQGRQRGVSSVQKHRAVDGLPVLVRRGGLRLARPAVLMHHILAIEFDGGPLGDGVRVHGGRAEGRGVVPGDRRVVELVPLHAFVRQGHACRAHP